jgi:thioredoxin 1
VVLISTCSASVPVGIDDFDRVVTGTRRPVLVSMGAPWCAPCQRVSAPLEKLARHRDDILVATIDLDENKAIARRYQVTQIPTFLLFVGGEPVERSVGTLSYSAMNALVDRNI